MAEQTEPEWFLKIAVAAGMEGKECSGTPPHQSWWYENERRESMRLTWDGRDERWVLKLMGLKHNATLFGPTPEDAQLAARLVGIGGTP